MLHRVFIRFVAFITVAATILFAVLPTGKSDRGASIPTDTSAATLAFVDVAVFDGTRLLADQTVLVEGARIVATGADVAVPDGATRIDGTGRTLLPGMIDAHVHTYGEALREAPRFGVTTVLDMFTDPALLGVQRERREGTAPTDTAALYSAGMLATVDGGHGTQYGIGVETLDGPDMAADWVARRKAEGSDWIKLVYMPESRWAPSMDLATASAVIDAAHAEGLLALAHVTEHDAALDLLKAGVDGFVHVFMDQPASAELLALVAARELILIPTLTVIGVMDGITPGRQWLEDASLGQYLTPGQRAVLVQDFGPLPRRDALATAKANVLALRDAGATVLAGTDAPNPGTAHGVSMHDELRLMVDAGLSPTEALAAATSTAASAFDLAGRGVIAPGARADLVLIAGDPTVDITATAAIEAVYRNGVELQREPTMVAEGEGSVVPSELGAFETGLDAPDGFAWSTTTDAMMGGASTAEIRRVSPGAGGSQGALRVSAQIEPGFAYPWAGAYLDASRVAPADISAYTQMQMMVRGTPGRYRMMVFTTGAYGAPPTLEFDVTDDWQAVTLTLADAGEFDPDQFIGMALVSPMQVGEYTLDVDDLVLVP